MFATTKVRLLTIISDGCIGLHAGLRLPDVQCLPFFVRRISAGFVDLLLHNGSVGGVHVFVEKSSYAPTEQRPAPVDLKYTSL